MEGDGGMIRSTEFNADPFRLSMLVSTTVSLFIILPVLVSTQSQLDELSNDVTSRISELLDPESRAALRNTAHRFQQLDLSSITNDYTRKYPNPSHRFNDIVSKEPEQSIDIYKALLQNGARFSPRKLHEAAIKNKPNAVKAGLSYVDQLSPRSQEPFGEYLEHGSSWSEFIQHLFVSSSVEDQRKILAMAMMVKDKRTLSVLREHAPEDKKQQIDRILFSFKCKDGDLNMAFHEVLRTREPREQREKGGMVMTYALIRGDYYVARKCMIKGFCAFLDPGVRMTTEQTKQAFTNIPSLREDYCVLKYVRRAGIWHDVFGKHEESPISLSPVRARNQNFVLE